MLIYLKTSFLNTRAEHLEKNKKLHSINELKE